MRVVVAFFFSLGSCIALAQQPQQQPPPTGCDSAESHQLDFWVGDWELSYVGGGTGRNRITKILEGCVVLEEFTGAPGTKLNGRSFSTFDRLSRKWKQTWVDDTGSYLDFTGGADGPRMVFAREAERNGQKFLQRMVFDDIKPDSLKWLWQRSADAGATWTTLWEIHYRRAR